MRILSTATTFNDRTNPGGSDSAHCASGKTRSTCLRASIAALCVTLLPVATIAASPASLPGGTYDLDIPSQDLDHALQTLALALQHKLLYKSQLVAGKTSPAIKGSFTCKQALDTLLAGTNLTHDITPSSVVLIRSNETPPPSSTPLPEGDSSEPTTSPIGGTVSPQGEAAPADTDSGSVTETIVVSGSRISVAGYTQPTPVTVVGEEVLLRDAKVSIGDTIRELPAVGASASPNNGSGAGNIVAGITGLDTVNLRQLGTTRTLVLFDGQRVVQSNVTGQIDLGTIPTALVERIDVVTAGASAAWGSDAVSGVVNLVLNKELDGFRVSADIGDSYEFDHTSYRVAAAAGTGFNDDRGRVIAAFNYMDSPEAVFANQRSWNKYRQLISNPAYTPTNDEPRYIHVDNIGLAEATTGGLITGPACLSAVPQGGTCARPNPLRYMQFVGRDAQLVPFDRGIVDGPISAGGDAEQLHPSIDNLTVDYSTRSAFGYASYELTDWLQASVQLNYGQTKSLNNSVPAIRQGNLRINVDNAYLPDSVRQTMLANGMSYIQVGTTNMNNLDPSSTGNYSHDQLKRMLGVPVATTDRKLKRGVFTLSGDLGGDWSWDAYYQQGKVRVYQTTLSNIINSNYNMAVDAVLRPGTSEIVCRSTLTNPDNGCVPLNIFGYGAASPEAIAYVNVKPGQNYQIQDLEETVIAASMQGRLGFGLPAGDIAIAFGAERRTEEGEITSDPGAQARIYSVANFPTFHGRYHVNEAFLELEIPLLSDSVIQSLSLNTAGRVTEYSTSGQVETWKLGLTSEIDDNIRFRGTVSRDIRAPNLNELFSSGLSTLGSAVDPNTNQNVQIFSFASGNPNLTPEIAKTYSVGLVLSPSWLPRFNLSVDYYSIDLQDAIFQIGTAEVLRRCNEGQTLFCRQLEFDGPGGALSQINTLPRNMASYKTDGLDVQLDYSLPLGAGVLAFRAVGNHVFNLSQEQQGVIYEAAGAIGADNPVQGFPRTRFTSSATYTQGDSSLTAQVRFISAAKLVHNWTAKDVDNNEVPAIAYLDLRASHDLTDGMQIFATIDNLLNKDPPNVAATPLRGQTAYYFTAVRGDIYDTIGRSYRAGVRFRF
jgi:iron complex outermembrane recepter protein